MGSCTKIIKVLTLTGGETSLFYYHTLRDILEYTPLGWNKTGSLKDARRDHAASIVNSFDIHPYCIYDSSPRLHTIISFYKIVIFMITIHLNIN